MRCRLNNVNVAMRSGRPAPLVEPADPFEDPEGERHDRLVNGFVRELPRGAHTSEKQVTLHGHVDGGPPAPATNT